MFLWRCAIPPDVLSGVPQYLGRSSGSKGYPMNVPLRIFPTGIAQNHQILMRKMSSKTKKIPKPEHLAGVFADIMFIQVVSQRQSPWNRSFSMAYLNLGLQKRAHFSGSSIPPSIPPWPKNSRRNKTWYFTNPKGLATGNPPAPWKPLRSLRALDSTATSEVKDLQTSNSVVKTMPFLPPMTGNGNRTTYKNGDDWGMVYHCFNQLLTLYPSGFWRAALFIQQATKQWFPPWLPPLLPPLAHLRQIKGALVALVLFLQVEIEYKYCMYVFQAMTWGS